jgi:hypothetical protein
MGVKGLVIDWWVVMGQQITWIRIHSSHSCGTGTATVCLSGIGTGMHSGSGTGFGSGYGTQK